MGFAEELVKNRKAANMTQEELAEKCDVSRQAVTKWERGESLPDVYMIERLAGMFSVSIEELIWSRDTAVIENKSYYVRLMEEADKTDFCKIMREHRYFGKLLKLIDKIDKTAKADDEYWDGYFCEGKTFVIRAKNSDSFTGYVYFESIDTHVPQMTMQFDSTICFEECDFNMIRDLLNWVSNEYNVRAVQAFTNSELERKLFAYLGYEKVKNEVLVVLPL